MNFVKYGGRRFLMTMGCGVACTVLVWNGKISDTVFQFIVVATVGVYIAGNTAQKKFEADAAAASE